MFIVTDYLFIYFMNLFCHINNATKQNIIYQIVGWKLEKGYKPYQQALTQTH